MDETEKYKQRLEAIAEKRRQQDEQDRARREMEDEKLRLQQLKRKSLRDQWLMEGAPLSPASPDAQNPRSPLWGSQAQETEKHIDKLESESQWLAEEKENEQMEDGQVQEVLKVTEAGAEMAQDDVVHNGENNVSASETTEDEVKTNKSPQLEETAVFLTNGGGDVEANHEASQPNIQSTTNGPICATEGVVSMKLEPGLNLGVSEAEHCHVPDVNTDKKKEEEEGSLVIRAERVIITDEGDDTPEDLTPQDDQQENMQSGETPLPNQEAGKEEGEAEEEVIKTEAAQETFTQPEKSEATESTAEAQPATGDGDVEGDIKTNENGDGETKADEQGKQSEDPTSMQLQSPATALEGTTVASLPVYSETQPSILAPKAEGEAATSPEGAERALKTQDLVTMPGQFQEVPLADSQERRTEAGPGEQEPLLSQAKALNTEAEPAAANSPANTETQSPTRDNGGSGPPPDSSKCKCCSVM